MTNQRKIVWTSIAGVAAAAITLTAIITSQSTAYASEVNGNGNITTQKVSVAAFNELKVGGNFKVIVNQGDAENVTLTTDSNLINDYKISVDDQTLKVKTKHWADSSPSQRAVLTITAPTLKAIDLSGNVSLNAAALNTPKLEIEMVGNDQANISGDIKAVKAKLGGNTQLTLNTPNADSISIHSGGRDQVTLWGKANTLEVHSGGNGTLDAKSLQANQVTLKISGKSTVTVNALKTLSINAAGDSTINYYGNPAVTNKGSAGRVEIKQLQS